MRSRFQRRLIVLALAFGTPVLGACSTGAACGNTRVQSGSAASIVAGPATHTIDERFFGFNLELTEFELSFWDRASRRVAPSLVAALAPFTGAVYRFPGGTTANHFDPSSALGAPASRKTARIVDWITLERIDFGFAEYAAFVKAVGGEPWYVLNLYGSIGSEAPLPELVAKAQRAAQAFEALGLKPLRYELGNELDRAEVKWPAARVIEHSRAIARAVRAVDAGARFTGMLSDYDSQADRGVTASEFNRAVVTALDDAGVGSWAQHMYYDGPPEGPPLPNRLAHLCRTVEDIGKAGGAKDRKAEIWVTEHARWPQPDRGRPWKSSWRRSADFDAALGTADFVIALSQMPAVKGGMLHALHATAGPWPLLHAGSEKGSFRPSVVFDAYRMLRETLLPGVLGTVTTSPKASGYAGGYDIRASVLGDETGKRFSVWAVNRANRPTSTRLRIESLSNRRATIRIEVLASPEGEASNHDAMRVVKSTRPPTELQFDADGSASIELPARAVFVATLASD